MKAPRALLGSKGVVFAALLVALGAQAEDKPPKAWADAFAEGQELQKAGDCARALEKYSEAISQRTSPLLRLRMAECQERVGKWVAALATYRLAANEARGAAEGELAQRADRTAAALAVQIPRLAIRRGPGAEKANVLLDGVALDEQSIGEHISADPGEHVIEALFPGEKSSKVSITLSPGDREAIVIGVPAGQQPRPARPKTEPRAPAPRADTEGPDRDSKPHTGPGPWPWIAGGAGVAAFGGAAAFYWLRQQKLDDVRARCVGDVCPTSARADYERAKTYALLGNVSFAIGVVGVGAGAVLFATGGQGRDSGSKRSAPRARLHLAPYAVTFAGEL